MRRPDTQIKYAKYMKENYPCNTDFEVMNQLVLYIEYLEKRLYHYNDFELEEEE